MSRNALVAEAYPHGKGRATGANGFSHAVQGRILAGPADETECALPDEDVQSVGQVRPPSLCPGRYRGIRSPVHEIGDELRIARCIERQILGGPDETDSGGVNDHVDGAWPGDRL